MALPIGVPVSTLVKISASDSPALDFETGWKFTASGGECGER
jgi:hypothetical protein